MDTQIVIQILTTLASLVGGLFGILKPMINQIVIRMDKRFDAIEKQYAQLSKELVDFKFETIGRYVQRAEMENLERTNTASHATVHTRLDNISEKVTIVETKLLQCPVCLGKKQ